MIECPKPDPRRCGRKKGIKLTMTKVIQKEENALGSAPLLPLITRFAIPAIISMLVGALYNITDQIFIGHVVGMLGNAATNVVFPTVTFTTGISMLFGVGAASNFSISQGAGNHDEARKYVHTGITGAAAAGLILGLIIYMFRSDIVVLGGAGKNGDVYPLALSYLSITAFGLPFYLFTNASAYIIRSDRSPEYSMLCNGAGAVLNVFLDWLFMYPMGLGLKGAAAATVISQITGFVLTLLYYPRFRSFRISVRELRISRSHMLDSMEAGIPNFVNHMLMMTTALVLNNVLEYYGAHSIYGPDIPLAVSGIAQKLNMIMVSFAVGIGQGCQPIWGYNLGAKRYDRVKSAYWRAFAAAFAIGVVFFICLQCFPREIISIFGTGSELYYEFAEMYLRIYMMLVFFQNIQPVTIMYFSSIGNHRQGLLVSLSRQGLFLIPLLLLLPRYFGIYGVFYASPVSDLMAFVMSVSMVIVSFKNFDRMEQNDSIGTDR